MRRQLPDPEVDLRDGRASCAPRACARPARRRWSSSRTTPSKPAKSHRTRSPATRVATSTLAPRHGATVGGTLPFSEHARGSPTLVQQEKEKARILSLKLADSITESEAYAFLRPLVMEGDVAQLSTKKLRQAMEEEFGVPLAHRKQFIDPIVMRILSERRAAEAEAEANADAAEVAAVLYVKLYAVVGAIEAAAEELAAERRAGYRLTRPDRTWSAAEDETVRSAVAKRQRTRLAPG